MFENCFFHRKKKYCFCKGNLLQSERCKVNWMHLYKQYPVLSLYDIRFIEIQLEIESIYRQVEDTQSETTMYPDTKECKKNKRRKKKELATYNVSCRCQLGRVQDMVIQQQSRIQHIGARDIWSLSNSPVADVSRYICILIRFFRKRHDLHGIMSFLHLLTVHTLYIFFFILRSELDFSS